MDRELRHYYDENGRHQVTLAASERPEDEICDFCCGSERPLSIFVCRPFRLLAGGDFICNFSSEWNACPTCSRIIEAGDRKALLDHSLDAGCPGDRTGVGIVQGAFWNNLIGRQS